MQKIVCSNCGIEFCIQNYEYKIRKHYKHLFCSVGCMTIWRKANCSKPDLILINKTCKICNVVKDINEFTRMKIGKHKCGRHGYCRKCLYKYQGCRWNKMKIRAIEYLGGKCKNCGIVDHPAIYDFHHRDPEQKDIDWRKLKIRKWESIVIELDKCNLLCCKCHRKEHINYDMWNLNYKYENADDQHCLICSIPIKNNMKYCSSICAHKAQEKVKWPNNLSGLVKATSISNMAKLLGVSHNAVVKRLNNHYYTPVVK